MSTWPELEKRINEVDEKIVALVQELEAHGDLKSTLNATGENLNSVYSEITLLSDSTRSAAKSLESILTSFRKAVEVVEQADPDKISKDVQGVEKLVNKTKEELKKTVVDVTSTMTRGQKDLHEEFQTESTSIQKSVSAGNSEIKDQLVEFQQGIKSSIDEVSGDMSKGQQKNHETLIAKTGEVKKAVSTGMSGVTERIDRSGDSIKETIVTASGELANALEKTDQRLIAETGEVKKAVSTGVSGITERIDHSEGRIKESIVTVSGELANALEKTDQRLIAEAQDIKKTIPSVVCYVTLGLAVVIFGLEVLRFFPVL